MNKLPILPINHLTNEPNYAPRAFPNNRVVMRPSEKFEAKAAGQKGSEAWFLHVENVFGRQRRHRALQPTAIERVIGIGSYMQNKANLLDAQMNLSSVKTKDYENEFCRKLQENKPNTNPIKPNFPAPRGETNPIRTQTNPISLNHDNLGRIISARIFRLELVWYGASKKEKPERLELAKILILA